MDLFQSIIPTLSNFVGLKSNNDEINNNSTSYVKDIEMSTTADIAINYKNRIIESIQNDESYIRRTPVSLYIKNLSIKLKGNSNNNIKDKIVVHPFNAFIEGGSLFCILGGSGSGKTTLLNIIAKRYDKKNVIVDGKISYKINSNNNNYYSNNNIGYVTQNDYLLPYLTVRETLIFVAKLKMSKDQNIISKRNEIVNQVIMDLGLKEVADSLIGENEWKRGLSGGN
jgi:ABC-type multidrug transport system ATPase subunit